jgi:hypothetical protein
MIKRGKIVQSHHIFRLFIQHLLKTFFCISEVVDVLIGQSLTIDD